ncbi:hypothetical protein NDU88_007486, partial [Pleurodeles waltl]
ANPRCSYILCSYALTVHTLGAPTYSDYCRVCKGTEGYAQKCQIPNALTVHALDALTYSA